MRTKNNVKKTRHNYNKKKEEIRKIEETIQKEKKNLPINYVSNVNITDSGVMGLSAGRNKGLDEIEKEIAELKVESNQL